MATLREFLAQVAKEVKADPSLLDMPFMVLDGSNGGGTPREINLGPMLQEVTEEDAEDAADCEGLEGQNVLVIGYGCY